MAFFFFVYSLLVCDLGYRDHGGDKRPVSRPLFVLEMISGCSRGGRDPHPVNTQGGG